MNLWELTNTVVNYEVDKHLLDLGYVYVKDFSELHKRKRLSVNGSFLTVLITVEINYSGKHENLLAIYPVNNHPQKQSLKYFNKNITLDEFKQLGDELIADFIDKLRR